MDETTRGHCPHGEFLLMEGCPDCILEERERRELEAEGETVLLETADAEVNSPDNIAKRIKEAEEAVAGKEVPRLIVKVQYYSDTKGTAGGRDYSYFTAEPLGLGEIVQVPVGGGRLIKAVVTAIDVPESEIEAFRDKVKTIPAGSVYPGAQVPPKEPAAAEPEPAQKEFTGVPLGEGVVATSSEGDWPAINAAAKPAALVTIETQVGKPAPELLPLYLEAASLHRVAKDRVIATNEDLKPATNDLAIIATCKKAMFARKTELVGPLKAKLDLVNKAFDDIMFPVIEADRLTRGQVTTFDNEQRRKAAEAKRIEDEKFRLAQDEMKLKGEHTQELGTAVAPPPVPEHTRTDLGTLGGRSNWKARVVDFALLPDEYKLPNESMLNSFARSTKGERPIPGVAFYDDRVVTMRTRGN